MPSSPHSHEAICSGTSPVPVLEFGIPDFGTPDDANSFASFVKEICEHSKRRQNVLIHCEGGIGRTGMVAQYVLLALSLPKEEAAGGGREQAESGGSKGMPPSSSPLVQTWRWAGFTIEHSTAISGLEESRQIDQPPHGPSPRPLGLLPWCWPGRCDRAIRHRWGDSLLFRKNLECDLTEWSWMSPARWPHVLWRYSLIWTRPRGLWLGHAAPVPPTFSGGSPRKVILLCLNRGMLWVEVGCRRLPFPALDPARSCLKDE